MARLRVEVVYARPGTQDLSVVELAAGATARDAVEASGLTGRWPELKGREIEFGMFGRVVEAGRALEDGDRIEILRPLQASPGEARRKRARRR